MCIQKNKELEELISNIEALYVENPSNLFVILEVYKDKISKYKDDTSFFKSITMMFEHAMYEDIELPQIDKLINEIGWKFGLLDVSLDDIPVSSLRVYCFYVLACRSVWEKSKLRYVFKTNDPTLLELADELEKEYNVRPEAGIEERN